MAKKDDAQDIDVSVEVFVDEILRRAKKMRASDVHIEPTEKNQLLIRFRIDGILNEETFDQIFESEKLIIRIKVLSRLDITVREIPQEGHFVFYDKDDAGHEQEMDVRVSIFPTIYGEAIVLRLLNRSDAFINIQELGFSPSALEAAKRLTHRFYGMVLVTGPVNSGKTTTLYSILQELNTGRRNIVTLEDPVEYHMPKMRQSQIFPARGFDFATGLRSILRQDPDIIMLGEIRDSDTAEIAIRASLTGRLVLSTLHTNSTIGTLARLIDMGIEHWLVAYALNGIIAQRLVGKVCIYCRIPYQPTAEVLRALNAEFTEGDKFFQGSGCDKCRGTGFHGRIGLFEVLELDEEIRNLVLERAPSSAIRAKAFQKGMQFLKDDGIIKAKKGLTTLEEVLRVAV
ncbi:MAG: hypothetical protein A2939_01270 [Parcubacteria group bacterium RIFCSPLOWO2_01_FULL_48_18]|nr:MAG: hypothetical protein A2939_01270 [Parcubacteria group bacterium RIFCSPLOWO2_01_FULL_48_18]OHB23621.1 MAG: hypothetical protein A3J67_00690 [Parcubacteria group bacterium RIFCSPHIGHO2_02_FULL_48_10b]